MATPTARFDGTPVAEAAALICAAVFGLLSMLLLIDGDPPARSMAIIGLPIAMSATAVFSRKREIVWVALGLCLGIAVVALPGSGFFSFWMGIFLFLWWTLASRRVGRPVVLWNDIFWEASAFVAMMLAIFV